MMIEPIGLVGTLIAIVQVCSKVVSVCYEYRSGVRDAPKDASRILDEVAGIRNIAETLVKVAESDLQPEATTSQLSRCLNELVDLKSALKLGKGMGRKAALRWPFKQPEAEKRLAVIGRIKATLQLAVSAGNAQKMVQILDNTSTLPLIQKEVLNLVDAKEKEAKNEERVEALRWLNGRDQSTKHQDEFKKCVEGTGDWLFHHDKYKEWKETPGQLLWLNGNAGCGKTVLCSNVVEDLQLLCERSDGIDLFYFYIDGSDQRRLTLETLYRSLIAQLATNRKQLPRFLESLYRRYRPEGYRGNKPVPAEKWLDGMAAALENSDRLYVVIDGLDECEESIGFEEIVGFINKLFRQRQDKVHAMAFSRNLEQLRNLFSESNATTIAIEGEALSFDLKKALLSQLSTHPKFSRWPRALKKTIETSLLSQAHGSFRWLDCQLQSLKKCATPVAVRNVLSDLPKSLEVYYSRVLESIEESNRQSVRNLLRWVAFSLRPLSLDELGDALAINSDDEVPFFDENLEMLDLEGFLDSCSSLVSTYSSIKGQSGQRSVYVKLAHYSVKEFLASDVVRSGDFGDFALDKNLAHSCLAASCLAYFHHAVTTAGDDMWEFDPLARYAGHYWPKHARLVDGNLDLQPLSSIVLDLFDAEKPFFKYWTSVISVDRPWLKEDATRSGDSADYTPIYCAAYMGLDWVVKILLDHGVRADEKSGLYGLPLHGAALQGHLGTVKVLIDEQIDIMAKGGLHAWAISAASANGHADVVRELLCAGASPQGWDSWSSWQKTDPLFLAASNGHLEVCELLLQHGARDHWHMKSRPGSALHAAVQIGCLDIVKVMLQYEDVVGPNSHSHRDIVVDSAGGFSASTHSAAAAGDIDMLRELAAYGITKEQLLRYAAIAGDKALVLETMDQGIDPDKPGCYSDHPSALQGAASAGHVDIVKELLKRGVNPDKEEHYSSPLDAAVQRQNFEIVQLLVEAGAPVDSPTLHPLDTALSLSSSEIINYLIQHGAEINPALRRSALRNRPKPFEKLIELGADISYRLPEDPPNMLLAAARGGAPATIKYLLDQGLDIESTFNQVTPLVEAVRSGHLEAVKFLLGQGANSNVLPVNTIPELPAADLKYQNGYPWPPQPATETCLTIAIRDRNQNIARHLLAHGAWPTPKEPVLAGTPLLYAIWEGYTELAKDLLDAGADPNQPGIPYRRKKRTFPLLLATEFRRFEIVKYLIEAGAHINRQDDEGFSPVHLASHCDKTDILKMLVQDYHARIDFGLLNGSRPIHSAASKGGPEHVQILLDAGADVNLENDNGRTPLHWAAERGNWDTMELLIETGADVTAKSKEDSPNTAWDLAHLAKENSSEWKYLRQMGERWDDARIDKLLERLK